MLYAILWIVSIPIWAFLVHSLYMSDEKKKEILFIILTIELCLIGGLRDFDTFNDSKSYSLHFYTVSDSGNFYEVPKERFERGYLIFEKFIHKYVSHHYSALFMIISAFTIGTAMYFFYKKSRWLWLTVFLYVGMRCYFIQIQAVRQSIAMALLLIAFLLFERRKRIMAVLMVFLASTFHSTAIVGLCIFPLFFIPLNKKSVLWFVIVAFLGIFSLANILNVFGYGDSTYLTDEGMQLGNVISVVCYVALLVYVWWTGSKKLIDENRMLVWGSMLCVICSIVALVVTAFNRVVDYFSYYAFLLLPNVMYASKHKKLHALIVFILVISMYIGILTLKPNWNKAFPYYFFWERHDTRYISIY